MGNAELIPYEEPVETLDELSSHWFESENSEEFFRYARGLSSSKPEEELLEEFFTFSIPETDGGNLDPLTMATANSLVLSHPKVPCVLFSLSNFCQESIDSKAQSQGESTQSKTGGFSPISYLKYSNLHPRNPHQLFAPRYKAREKYRAYYLNFKKIPFVIVLEGQISKHYFVYREKQFIQDAELPFYQARLKCRNSGAILVICIPEKHNIETIEKIFTFQRDKSIMEFRLPHEITLDFGLELEGRFLRFIWHVTSEMKRKREDTGGGLTKKMKLSSSSSSTNSSSSSSTSTTSSTSVTYPNWNTTQLHTPTLMSSPIPVQIPFQSSTGHSVQHKTEKPASTVTTITTVATTTATVKTTKTALSASCSSSDTESIFDIPPTNKTKKNSNNSNTNTSNTNTNTSKSSNTTKNTKEEIPVVVKNGILKVTCKSGKSYQFCTQKKADSQNYAELMVYYRNSEGRNAKKSITRNNSNSSIDTMKNDKRKNFLWNHFNFIKQTNCTNNIDVIFTGPCPVTFSEYFYVAVISVVDGQRQKIFSKKIKYDWRNQPIQYILNCFTETTLAHTFQPIFKESVSPIHSKFCFKLVYCIFLKKPEEIEQNCTEIIKTIAKTNSLQYPLLAIGLTVCLTKVTNYSFYQNHSKAVIQCLQNYTLKSSTIVTHYLDMLKKYDAKKIQSPNMQELHMKYRYIYDCNFKTFESLIKSLFM